MNWLTNSVLPKIKAMVSSEDATTTLWVKCKSCGQMIFAKEFEANYHVCLTCSHHAPLPPQMRFAQLFDDANFTMIDLPTNSDDPLKFRDSRKYADRLKDSRTKTGAYDAIAVASGTIQTQPAVVAAFDFRFMGGSMGRSVGDAILAAADAAVSLGAALITVPSTGGARMQEGIFSLMQMPRTIIGVDRVREAGLPYFVLLAHPTTGGVSASFAMLGDIQVAEPGAIIGFAGRRVIEETVREELPADFQTAEYLQDHGMVDGVVARADQPAFFGRTIAMLMNRDSVAKSA